MAEIDRSVVQALANFRFERGESNSALTLDAGANGRSVDNDTARRSKVTSGIAAAIAGLDGMTDQPGLPEFAAALNAQARQLEAELQRFLNNVRAA